jgi:hypothetical protein
MVVSEYKIGVVMFVSAADALNTKPKNKLINVIPVSMCIFFI